MQIQQSSYTVLIPHNTPLCSLEQEHSRILCAARTAQPDAVILPFYPQVCVVDSPIPAAELKTAITGCIIEPPVFLNGLYIRPVSIAAKDCGTVSAGMLPPYIIPLQEHKKPFPAGIVFGRIQNAEQKQAAVSVQDSHNIKPLHLRVFRLHTMHITASAYSEKETPPFTWTLSPPQWVKLLQ